MNSIKLEIEMPEEILNFIDYKDKNYYRKAKEILLYQLVKENKISFGKAAELMEIPKIQYIEELGAIGIPYFDADIDEVMQDVKRLDALMGDK